MRPYTTEVIDGNNGNPVAEGQLVTLMCRVDGARPAAVITWYNGTTPFNQQSAEHIALKVSHQNNWVISIHLVNGIEEINQKFFLFLFKNTETAS